MSQSELELSAIRVRQLVVKIDEQIKLGQEKQDEFDQLWIRTEIVRGELQKVGKDLETLKYEKDRELNLSIQIASNFKEG